ncbi:MAG: geranylgeranylglyceryl/heptaprenylglyceryl phosphate synthase [Bacteroidota bacterium]
MSILQYFRDADGPKFAILIDPDKAGEQEIDRISEMANEGKVSFFFVGGSHITSGDVSATITQLQRKSNIPVILFPGSVLQIEPAADAMLFLSLISGRNPEYLIGQHVIAAPYLAKAMLETIPTGYMLMDGGKPTTASYMSNSTPLPMDKPGLAASTALAGELLGLKLIYADCGSGAEHTVSPEIIRAIKSRISIPLIVGGGIRSKKSAEKLLEAGADILVVGNAIEKNPTFIKEIASLF